MKYQENNFFLFCQRVLIGNTISTFKQDRKNDEIVKVDILDLKEKNKLLKVKIEKCELSHINLNNCLKDVNTFWNSQKSMLFFNCTDEIKSDIDMNLLFFKEINDIYSEIIEKYARFGNRVNINLESKDNIIFAFDNYLNSLREIKNLCSEICNYCSDGLQMLQTINSLIFLTQSLRKIILDDFSYIAESERIICMRCSNLNFRRIKEFDFNGESL